jgi:sigma-E factor negative regulatory protein RseB
VLALAGLLFCGPLSAATSDKTQTEPADAKEWIRSMREAGLRLQFHGVAAYWRNEQLGILRIRHEVVNGQEREQVEALDSTDGEDIAPLSATNTETGGAEHNPSRIGNWPLNLSMAERYYRFAIGREGRITGRNAREIVITPLDEARYGRRVWIDRESRLPLKHELIAPDGRILEQFVFAELTISESPPPVDQIPANDSPPLMGMVPVQQAIDTLAWRLDNVPKGYRIVAYARHNAPNNALVEHLLLSDGFSSISVYIEETQRAFPNDGRLRHLGAMHVFTRQLGQYRITVMAEAPAHTVIRIAQGVRRGES